MRTITLDGIMDLRPCYSRDKVADLMGDRANASMRDIATAEHVPVEDRVWLLIHILTEPEQHEAACRFAEVALWNERRAGREPDPRSWAAIDAKRAWLQGKISDADLYTALCAAHNAAEDAAASAAEAAARAAAAAAAEARAAATAAAEAEAEADAAAGSADGATALEAARRHQIEIILDLAGES